MKTISYEWKNDHPLTENGVIVGLSANHEWMLEWWFMNFRRHNSYPVTFVDFGDLSEGAKAWCREKGGLISLEINFNHLLSDKDKLTKELIQLWEGSATGVDIWKSRQEFFKKPFACLASPYKQTIWMDLDCMVLKSIEPIFAFCENPLKMALVKEPPSVLLIHKQAGILYPDEMEYNTGVVVFEHGCNMISAWARYCVESSTCLRGDQEALSRYVYDLEITLPELPNIYNWRAHIVPSQEIEHKLVIIHFLGKCKEAIPRLKNS